MCDPNDSLTVYVAALGRLWGPNPERGVYRTKDGGRSWSQVLKLDPNTGCIDLALDPSRPSRLYAAMYARRRSPWSFTGVSETGGIFRTEDGGAHWTRCTDGLPRRTGRIGLSVYAKNPNVVYAVVESDEGGRLSDFEETSRAGGVFRSDDAGVHWKRVSPFKILLVVVLVCVIGVGNPSTTTRTSRKEIGDDFKLQARSPVSP